MKVTIPRLTFRLHDNPLLENSSAVVVIIEKERLPTEDYDIFMKNMNWNHQQFNLLLQTIKGHARDLSIPLYLCYADIKELPILLSALKSSGIGSINTDYMSDPAFTEFDKAIETTFPGTKMTNTFTLLDWRNSEHLKVLGDYYKKAKPFSKLTPLKEYIVEQMSHRTKELETTPNFSEPVDLSTQLSPWIVDLDSELKKLSEKMLKLNMTVHHFGHEEQGSFDKQVVSHADQSIDLIDGDRWYKPSTVRGLEWDLKTCMKGMNTSQLSPFLSIGSLSVKYFWNKIQTSNTKIGSAKDQLMWRETFNATAIGADCFKGNPKYKRLPHFWNDDITSPFLDHKAVEYEWKKDPELIEAWKKGDIEGDAGKSMKTLWENGWIHHLQRHLVADTLTRGSLGQMWTEGMYWFRYTLLDHDSAVNRANWMWLSAVAFSSKQKAYHYGKDYISRPQGTPPGLKPIDRKSGTCK